MTKGRSNRVTGCMHKNATMKRNTASYRGIPLGFSFSSTKKKNAKNRKKEWDSEKNVNNLKKLRYRRILYIWNILFRCANQWERYSDWTRKKCCSRSYLREKLCHWLGNILLEYGRRCCWCKIICKFRLLLSISRLNVEISSFIRANCQPRSSRETLLKNVVQVNICIVQTYVVFRLWRCIYRWITRYVPVTTWC